MSQNPVSFRLAKKRSNVAKKLPILRKNAENKFSLNKSWKETVTKQMEKILLKKFLFILRRRLPAPPTRPLNSHKVESYFPLWLPGDQCLCVDNQESNPWHWICFSKEHISEENSAPGGDRVSGPRPGLWPEAGSWHVLDQRNSSGF